MSIFGMLVTAAVAAQLTVTPVLQPCRRNRWVMWLDRAAIVPMWMFFALGDIVEDWQLHVRDGIGDTPLGPWRQVPLAPPRGAVSALWNPHKHVEGRRLKLLETLARRHLRQPGFDPAHSRAYPLLLVLAHAGEALQPGATARQFAIVRCDSTGSHETLFTSRFHPTP